MARLAAEHPEIFVSVSATTRPPRPGEVHGQHYLFVSPAEFDALIADGALLEWAVVQSCPPRCDQGTCGPPAEGSAKGRGSTAASAGWRGNSPAGDVTVARRPGKGPTAYPVACSPQAWAAGAVFLVLQACLGLSIRAKESRIYLHYPRLPEALQLVRIRNLRIGSSSLDLVLERHAETVGVRIERRTGDVEVVALS